MSRVSMRSAPLVLALALVLTAPAAAAEARADASAAPRGTDDEMRRLQQALERFEA